MMRPGIVNMGVSAQGKVKGQVQGQCCALQWSGWVGCDRSVSGCGRGVVRGRAKGNERPAMAKPNSEVGGRSKGRHRLDMESRDAGGEFQIPSTLTIAPWSQF